MVSWTDQDGWTKWSQIMEGLQIKCWRIGCSVHRTRAWPARIPTGAARSGRLLRRRLRNACTDGEYGELLLELLALTGGTLGPVARSQNQRFEPLVTFQARVLEYRHAPRISRRRTRRNSSRPERRPGFDRDRTALGCRPFPLTREVPMREGMNIGSFARPTSVGGSGAGLGGPWNRTFWVRHLWVHARKGGGPVDSSIVSVEVASP